MGLQRNRLRDGELAWGLKVKVSGPMGTGRVECKKVRTETGRWPRSERF